MNYRFRGELFRIVGILPPQPSPPPPLFPSGFSLLVPWPSWDFSLSVPHPNVDLDHRPPEDSVSDFVVDLFWTLDIYCMSVRPGRGIPPLFSSFPHSIQGTEGDAVQIVCAI